MPHRPRTAHRRGPSWRTLLVLGSLAGCGGSQPGDGSDHRAGTDDVVTDDTFEWFGDAPLPDAAPPALCAQHTTCGACAADPAAASGPCVWCRSTATCLESDATGAADAGCAGDERVWSQDMCAAPCATLAACGTCAAVNGCGWCRATHRCASGTLEGSNDGACSGDPWVWSAGLCTADGG